MKKYLFLTSICIGALFVLVSCEQNKEYECHLIYENELKNETRSVSALNDSLAYIDGAWWFMTGLEEYSKHQDIFSQPISFYVTRKGKQDTIRTYATSYDNKIKEIVEEIEKQRLLEQKRWAENQETIKNLRKYFDYEIDEFTKKTFVEPKARPKYINVNGCYCYFQLENDVKAYNLRMKLQYEGNNWIFFSHVQWNVDGWTYEYTPSEIKRDHDSRVWEWFDDSSKNDALALLIVKIANCKSASYRLMGNTRTQTFKLTSAQIEAIKRTYDLYLAYNGEL